MGAGLGFWELHDKEIEKAGRNWLQKARDLDKDGVLPKSDSGVRNQKYSFFRRKEGIRGKIKRRNTSDNISSSSNRSSSSEEVEQDKKEENRIRVFDEEQEAKRKVLGNASAKDVENFVIVMLLLVQFTAAAAAAHWISVAGTAAMAALHYAGEHLEATRDTVMQMTVVVLVLKKICAWWMDKQNRSPLEKVMEAQGEEYKRRTEKTGRKKKKEEKSGRKKKASKRSESSTWTESESEEVSESSTGEHGRKGKKEEGLSAKDLIKDAKFEITGESARKLRTELEQWSELEGELRGRISERQIFLSFTKRCTGLAKSTLTAERREELVQKGGEECIIQRKGSYYKVIKRTIETLKREARLTAPEIRRDAERQWQELKLQNLGEKAARKFVSEYRQKWAELRTTGAVDFGLDKEISNGHAWAKRDFMIQQQIDKAVRKLIVGSPDFSMDTSTIEDILNIVHDLGRAETMVSGAHVEVYDRTEADDGDKPDDEVFSIEEETIRKLLTSKEARKIIAEVMKSEQPEREVQQKKKHECFRGTECKLWRFGKCKFYHPRAYDPKIDKKQEEAKATEETGMHGYSDEEAFVVDEEAFAVGDSKRGEYSMQIDDACTIAIIKDKELIKIYDETPTECTTINGQSFVTSGRGTVSVWAKTTSGGWAKINMKEARYVPGARRNLWPSHVMMNDEKWADRSTEGYLLHKAGDKIKVERKNDKGFVQVWLSKMQADGSQEEALAVVEKKKKGSPEAAMLEHARKGHIGGVPEGIVCEICTVASMGRYQADEVQDTHPKAEAFGDIVTCDAIGPRQESKYGGRRFAYIMRDKYTGLKMGCFLKGKKKAGLQCVQRWIVRWQKMRCFYPDGAGELYEDHELIKFLAENKIRLLPSAEGNHTKHAHAESENGFLQCHTRKMMFEAGEKTADLWNLAMAYAIWVENRMPRVIEGRKIVPLEIVDGKEVDTRSMHIWGCKAYVLPPVQKKSLKIIHQAKQGRFVGIDERKKSWMVIVDEKLITGRTARFIEEPRATLENHVKEMYEQYEDAEEVMAVEDHEKEIADDECEMEFDINGEMAEEAMSIDIMTEKDVSKCEKCRMAVKKEAQKHASPIGSSPPAITVSTEKEIEDAKKAGMVLKITVRKQEKRNDIIKARFTIPGYLEKRAKLGSIRGKLSSMVDNINLKVMLVYLSWRSKQDIEKGNTVNGMSKTVLRIADAVSAYLTSEYKRPDGLSTRIVCKMPKWAAQICGYEYGTVRGSVNGLLYGSWSWELHRNKQFQEEKWSKVPADDAVFTKEVQGRMILMATHVDDLPGIGQEEDLYAQYKELNKRMPLEVAKVKKVQGHPEIEVHDVLGIVVIHCRRTGQVLCDQSKYFQKVLDNNMKEAPKPQWCPMGLTQWENLKKILDARMKQENATKLTQEEEGLQTTKLHWQGAINYGTSTRYDIVPALRPLSSAKPHKEVIRGLQGVAVYAAGTKRCLDLTANKNEPLLGVSTDSDWATETDRKSVGAQVVKVLGATVHAGSKKQSFYATSSTEAEIDAQFMGVKRTKVIKNFITSAKIFEGMDKTIISMIDSKPATAYTEAEHPPAGTKHLDLKYLQMRQETEQAMMKTIKIPRDTNPADHFVRPAGAPRATYDEALRRFSIIEFPKNFSVIE